MTAVRVPNALAAASTSVLAQARAIATALSGVTTLAALDRAEAQAAQLVTEARELRMSIRSLMAAERRRLRDDAAARERSDHNNERILNARRTA